MMNGKYWQGLHVLHSLLLISPVLVAGLHSHIFHCWFYILFAAAWRAAEQAPRGQQTPGAGKLAASITYIEEMSLILKSIFHFFTL